jgi:hypothetical protein
MEGQTLYQALKRDPILGAFPLCEVVALESLDSLIRQGELARPLAIVVNTDTNPEGPGEHWVVIYADTEKTKYFDSYGMNPTRVGVYRLLNHLAQPWERNTRCLQDFFSSVCGYYCLYYLLRRSRGHRLKDIVQVFGEDPGKNDTLVKKTVRHHFKLG